MPSTTYTFVASSAMAPPRFPVVSTVTAPLLRSMEASPPPLAT
ncbi:MAG: hypothetical protein ACRELB_07675 [Polyangiaceae bacterium]